VHEALANSAGIRLVAQFGKVRSGSGRTDAAALSRDTGYPPVQIYQVSGAQPAAEVVGAGQTMRVYGGPEALLELASAGLLRNRPVVLNSDHAGVPVRDTVLTDLLRKRVRHFGEIRADFSQTLTASAHYQTSEAANDYMKPCPQLPIST
jgi:arabinofuranan 3-O-arabinosyltransferase